MDCPNCDFENGQLRKFCSEWAPPLPLELFCPRILLRSTSRGEVARACPDQELKLKE